MKAGDVVVITENWQGHSDYIGAVGILRKSQYPLWDWEFCDTENTYDSLLVRANEIELLESQNV